MRKGKMLKVINLWGGPNTGKSTVASGLFNKMKKRGLKVELITEHAKDMVYTESYFQIKDQLYVFTRQHHKIWAVKDKVDWVIVDSPLPLSLIYMPEDMIYDKEIFTDLVMSTFYKYENFNFFLERDNDIHTYQEFGRIQTLEESMTIDNRIQRLLREHKVPYQLAHVSDSTEDAIFANIRI